MKALLVIDVDDNVDLDSVYIAYDLCSENSDGWSDVIDFGTCPLKPMPEKWEGKLKNNHPMSIIAEAMRDGWNMCLEEILGETNEQSNAPTDEEADCCGVQFWHDD